MSDLPEPLTPPDCDLRGLEYMPLLGDHLFGSEFNARASDSEWRAAITLWWAAWRQMPAASLPDDDAALCRFADLGRDLKTWKKLRAGALHGWVKCADGRLYHPLLAKQAIIAWDKRVKERERKANWRAKKHGQDADVPRDNAGTGWGQDGQVPADVTRRDGTGQYTDRTNVLSGAVAPPDPEKLMFDSGVALLRAGGKSESQSRSLLGKWRKAYGSEAVIVALGTAKREGAVDPVSFIEAALRARHRARDPCDYGTQSPC